MKRIILLTLIILFSLRADAAKRIIVAQDESGNYKTVQEAISSIPDYNPSTIEIFIKKGTYKERITVSVAKTNITLIGEDVKETVLTYDNYATKLDSAGKILGTGRAGSFMFMGQVSPLKTSLSKTRPAL